jgi:hypothetical protein
LRSIRFLDLDDPVVGEVRSAGELGGIVKRCCVQNVEAGLVCRQDQRAVVTDGAALAVIVAATSLTRLCRSPISGSGRYASIR